VLEDKKISRLGNSQSIDVDFRLISATRRDLQKEIAKGRFRQDFFYRINVIRLDIPPLRERKEDIPLLVDHFLNKYSQETTKHVDHLTARAREHLMQYDWPGNVRELENAIERAVVLAKSRSLRFDDFAFLHPARAGEPEPTAGSLRDVEKVHIAAVLKRSGWNVTRAAKILGINRVTLHKKIKRYELER
jgi:two-component system response regulator HydG